LFVTGYSATGSRAPARFGPHDRVLEKPYQLAELVQTIRGMLQARVLRASMPADRAIACAGNALGNQP